MKTVAWTIFGIYVACAVVATIILMYHLDRDIDSMIDRAQVAADREDMLSYVKQLKDNMDRWDMKSGHTALIFTNSRNDMALHYKAIERVIERLESIKDIPKSDTAYQVALSDIRGVIRELPNPATGWFWVCYGWWLLLVAVITFVIAGMIHLGANDAKMYNRYRNRY